MPPLPRIKTAEGLPSPYCLRVTWLDGRITDIDMSGTINRVKAFQALLDPNLFRQAQVVDSGHGIEWPNGLDYAATSLDFLAQEQTPFTSADFVAWQTELRLSNQETADLLDSSLSTVKNYRSGHKIPKPITMACRATLREPALAMAHLRPRQTGRPRKGAA